MRTLKLTLAYDGTRFVGWQRQAEGESIQGLLEEALAQIRRGAGHRSWRRPNGRRRSRARPGRERAGDLHACAATLGRALNAILPDDHPGPRRCRGAADFHARFDARSKTYRYHIANRRCRRSVRARVRVALAGAPRCRRYACGRGSLGRHARFRGVSECGDRCDQQHPHDLRSEIRGPEESAPLLVETRVISQSGADPWVRDRVVMKSPATASFGTWSARSSARSSRSAAGGGPGGSVTPCSPAARARTRARPRRRTALFLVGWM